MADATVCGRHGAGRAGWRCRACAALLCARCVWVQRVGTVELLACCRCRGPVDRLTRHRREARSFAARLPGALAYPFVPGTLAGVAAAACVLALFSYGGMVGAILRYSVYWAFLFAIVRQTARGARSFEAAELGGEGIELLLPAVRGFLATAIVWLPGAIWFFTEHGVDVAGGVRDPVLWLFLVAGIVYAPAAVMHAATGGRTLEMLNPLWVGSFVVRLGADYALAVLAIVGLGVADLLLTLAGLAVRATPVPFLSRAGAEVVGLLAPAAMARVVGLLLYVRGDDLGYGVPEDYEEPLVPDATPLGSEPVLATVAVSPEPAAPPPAAAAAAATAARVQAILSPQPASPPAPPAPGDVAALVAASDLVGALAAFRAHPGPPESIPPRALFAVAKAASDAGEHLVAARALYAAARGDDASVAPSALLVLARVYERRLGRAAHARQVLEHLVSRWPDSDAARHARAALEGAATS
jgi:hypothetical protein